MTAAQIRSLARATMLIYVVVLLALTLAPLDGINPGSAIDLHLAPFSTIRMALRQGPGSHEFAVAIGNLAAFMPLGILLPLITRRRSLWQVIASGAALSAAVELAQLAISAFLGFGYRTADIDDLILNTIGAAMGFAALVLLGSIGRSDATARS